MATKIWNTTFSASNQQIYLLRVTVPTAISPFQLNYWPANASPYVYSPVMARTNGTLLATDFIVSTNANVAQFTTFMATAGITLRCCYTVGTATTYVISVNSTDAYRLKEMYPPTLGWYPVAAVTT